MFLMACSRIIGSAMNRSLGDKYLKRPYKEEGWFFLMLRKAAWGLTPLYLLLTAGTGFASEGHVLLLKHPYPYMASLTILSDLHRTTIEEFEAVHKLINSEDLILKGSDEWNLLGFEGVILSGDVLGVRGFGFPFSDTFWVYDEVFSIFKDYDPEAGSFVKHSNGDLEERFLTWYKKGYVDALHTFGPGKITRQKAKAAAGYLTKGLPRPVIVHVNHSKSRTPAGVGGPCCTLLNQMLVHARYFVFNKLGVGDGLAKPKDLPNHLLEQGFFILLGATSFLVLLLFLRRAAGIGFRIRSLKMILVSIITMGAAIGWLQFKKVDFYKGDDPDSRYYNLDLLRELGVRFYWTVNSDYLDTTVSTISLPEEEASTGRSSIFQKIRFEDGTYGMFFKRNTINGKAKTLSLLSKPHLEELLQTQGWSIIYLHWLSNPKSYFGRDGVYFLSNLKGYSHEKRIWTPSARELLLQAYAYSYVRFSVSQEKNGVAHLMIEGFDDPVLGFISADAKALANLSFRCTSCRDLVVFVGGSKLSEKGYRIERDGRDLVVTIGSNIKDR